MSDESLAHRTILLRSICFICQPLRAIVERRQESGYWILSTKIWLSDENVFDTLFAQPIAFTVKMPRYCNGVRQRERGLRADS
jgi:hypothetical protein